MPCENSIIGNMKDILLKDKDLRNASKVMLMICQYKDKIIFLKDFHISAAN